MKKETMKIYTADKETGTFIDEFTSIGKALKEIERYESMDRKDGVYVENFYDVVVVNEEHESLL